MLYLPFERYEIESPLFPEEISKKIAINIESKSKVPFLLPYKGDKKFKGTISENHFLISRIISGTNSFLPMIEGNITSNTSGSKIQITMRLRKSVFWFMIFWMSLAFLVPVVASFKSVSSIISILLKPHFVNLLIILGILLLSLLIALFMPVIGYLTCIILFNKEVKKGKELLKDIVYNQGN